MAPSPRGLTFYRLLLIAVPLVAGCATLFGTSHPNRGTLPCCAPADPTALHLQYLGTGGWLIRYGETELLTAPFFSNPSALAQTFGAIGPDTAAIERGLPPVERVTGLLVGHAHYDHLMDVPYILAERAPMAQVYGSTTMVNVLAAAPGVDPARVHALDAEVGAIDAAGAWVTLPGGRLRFMALQSDHAPHFQGIELYEGDVRDPLDELPSAASDWVGGNTLAYLIDFLELDGSVAFRVHYQDAAASWPGGAPPKFDAPYDHPVDVAILCAPSYGEVEAYPEGILGVLNPRVALVGHWEDFFSEWTRAPGHSVIGSDVNGFTNRLKRALPDSATWALPNPGDTIVVPAYSGYSR